MLMLYIFWKWNPPSLTLYILLFVQNKMLAYLRQFSRNNENSKNCGTLSFLLFALYWKFEWHKNKCVMKYSKFNPLSCNIILIYEFKIKSGHPLNRLDLCKRIWNTNLLIFKAYFEVTLKFTHWKLYFISIFAIDYSLLWYSEYF